jgi:hypothetical protein
VRVADCGASNKRWSGMNMTNERESYPRILKCPDPDACGEEHNLCGQEDHHVGCECWECQTYVYTKLK